MASLVAILDLKGKPLIQRSYRDDIPPSYIERFLPLVLELEEESQQVPPCVTSQGINFMHIRHSNVYRMCSFGSSIELIIIARCTTPTNGSALPGAAVDGALEKPWSLYWALHIVWKDGIAERRGVCQIFQSTLEEAVEPKPEVKLILLG